MPDRMQWLLEGMQACPMAPECRTIALVPGESSDPPPTPPYPPMVFACIRYCDHHALGAQGQTLTGKSLCHVNELYVLALTSKYRQSGE